MLNDAPIACRAIATPMGEPIYSLRFELRNQGPASIELPIYEPFTAFSILATAGGKPLTVHQPVLDIGVRRATLRLEPKATTIIQTPIRLRIAENAKPGTDGFVWTIAHAREGLSLAAKLELTTLSALVSPVEFE
ncbi:MAG: hypothetical protein ABSB60_08375 [Terracidiphilus sp.]